MRGGRSSVVRSTVDLGVEAGGGEQPQPRRRREQAGAVGLVHDLHRPVGVAQHEGVLGRRPRVGGVRVPVPRQVPGGPAVGTVVAAVVGLGPPRLGRVVGDHDDDPARSAVLERGAERRQQVVLGEHVAHGVVDEHGVEGPPQPHGAHVADDVVARRVEPARHLDHRGTEVDERHREPRPQVDGVVAAAAAQLEHVHHRDPRPRGGGAPPRRPPRRTRRGARSAATTGPGPCRSGAPARWPSTQCSPRVVARRCPFRSVR